VISLKPKRLAIVLLVMTQIFIVNGVVEETEEKNFPNLILRYRTYKKTTQIYKFN